jgi:hypothetical protein
MSSTNAERKKSGSAYSAKKKASSSDRKETFALAGASGLSTSASSLAYSPTASPSPPSYGSGYGSSGGTGGEYRYSDDSDENNLGNQTSLFTKMVYRDIETVRHQLSCTVRKERSSSHSCALSAQDGLPPAGGHLCRIHEEKTQRGLYLLFLIAFNLLVFY